MTSAGTIPSPAEPEVPAVPARPGSSRSVKVLALSLGSGLALVANIVVGMAAARLLSKHDYATIRQTFLAYDVVSPLLLLGLPNALYYFLPRAETDRRGVLIDSIALLTALGLIFSLFILLGGHALLAHVFDNPELGTTLPWLAIYPLFMMPIAGIAGVLVVADRVRSLACFNTGVSLAQAACAIGAIYVTRSYELPIVIRICVAGLALPTGLWLMFRSVKGTARRPRGRAMAEMVRYAAPLGLAGMLGSIMLQLDAFIVAALCPPELFAVYINGAIEIPIVSIVVGSITAVIFADMSAACARGDKAGALAIFKLASVKSACILLPAMIYFLVAAKPFILFLYSREYSASVIPFVIYLCVLPTRIVVYGAALMAIGMTRQLLLRSIFDLSINVVLCFIFVSLFGYNGAALGLVVTIYAWTVPYNLIKIGQGYGVGLGAVLPWRQLGAVLLISIATAPPALAALYLLQAQPAFLQLAISFTLYGPLCLYILYRQRLIAIPPFVAARLGFLA